MVVVAKGVSEASLKVKGTVVVAEGAWETRLQVEAVAKVEAVVVG